MKRIHTILPALAAISLTLPVSAEQAMDKMWGDRSAKEGVEGSKRAELFRDGNYGMFIHWGLYSHLGGQWKDKTFYGIGEWIKNQMQIGKHKVSVSLVEGDPAKSSLEGITFTPVR